MIVFTTEITEDTEIIIAFLRALRVLRGESFFSAAVNHRGTRFLISAMKPLDSRF